MGRVRALEGLLRALNPWGAGDIFLKENSNETPSCSGWDPSLAIPWLSHISLVWGKGDGAGRHGLESHRQPVGKHEGCGCNMPLVQGHHWEMLFSRVGQLGELFCPSPVTCVHFSPHCNLQTLSAHTGLTWDDFLLPSPLPGSVM